MFAVSTGNDWSWPVAIGFALHIVLVWAVAFRVVMKRPQAPVALAWLFLIALTPYVGVFFYLLIGERRISGTRIKRLQALRTEYREIAQAGVDEGHTRVDWSRHAPAARGMSRLVEHLMGVPPVCGSSYELCVDTEEVLSRIAKDVDAATTSVLMEFYIWNEGGRADDVLKAVIRAARRGVSCRLLIDAVGARPWWKGQQPQQLRDAGVDLQPALPVGLFRSFIGRTDLRLHRKIVVIDGSAAWTGSMNLVDPRFFKQDSGVGQWVDAMVRLEGPAVVVLALVMLNDWLLETGETLDDVLKSAGIQFVQRRGSADIQVVPSGPGESGDCLLQVILTLVHSAEQELILTTPYLVPDDSLLRALRGAAGRGVAVKLIVPEKVDSFLTRYASRSYFDDLLEIGVEIHLYQGGLLHTKSIMVDGRISMFGTVNLDMRSLWLNFEVTLFTYDVDFASQLRTIQQTYLNDSRRLQPEEWNQRPSKDRILENTLRLFSPML